MLDYLKEQGISNETISILEQICSEPLKYDISINQKNVIETINYLQEIGIKVIDELLIINIDLFIYPIIILKKKLSKINIQELVSNVNETPEEILLLNNID